MKRWIKRIIRNIKFEIKDLTILFLKAWNISIFAILLIAGVSLLFEKYTLSLSLQQTQGLFILTFALIHFNFIAERIQEMIKGDEKNEL